MGIIAIFGGTFNPIHIGHREIIEEILNIQAVEKVIVIPTKIPPHKTVSYMASEQDRVAMCKLATKDLSRVEVSDLELKREGKSYTVDTVRALSNLYPDKDIAITIGADMVVTFDEWKDYKTILSSAKIITFARVGTDFSEYSDGIKFLENLGGDIYSVNKRISNVSSSMVREALKSNDDVEQYLSEEVLKYVRDNNLYRACNDR